jgi:hypothetical protein
MRMTKYQDIRSTLLALAGNENAIVVHKAFVEFTGGLEAGMMLGQLLYWTPRAKRNDGFIAKSYEEWSDELCLTQYGVRKAKKVLEEMGVLETKLKKWDGAPTIHYRLDMDELDHKWICWIRKMETTKSENGNAENSESITETTSENTSNTHPPVNQQEGEIISPPSSPRDENAESHAEFESYNFGREYREKFPDDDVGLSPPRGDEPWLLWGDDKVQARGGVEVNDLRRVGWLIEQGTGMYPVDGEWSGWLKALGQVLKAAGGDFERVKRGIALAWDREEKYRPGHPMGFVKAVRKVQLVPEHSGPPDINDLPDWWEGRE